MLKAPVLRTDAEAEVVITLDPARRVRHAVDVFRRPLRDAAFAVAAETLNGEPRAAEINRIRSPREIAKADVRDPVAVVQTDWPHDVIRVVVAKANFVDDGGRDHPGLADGEVSSLLRHSDRRECAWIQLRA